MLGGGSPSMLEGFPGKPKGMHWETYDRLRRAHDITEAGSMGLTQLSIAYSDERALHVTR
jgi:hypothetical protein